MVKSEFIAQVQENIDIEVSKKDLGTILDGFVDVTIYDEEYKQRMCNQSCMKKCKKVKLEEKFENSQSH